MLPHCIALFAAAKALHTQVKYIRKGTELQSGIFKKDVTNRPSRTKKDHCKMYRH